MCCTLLSQAKNKPNNELRKEDVRLVVNANIISKHLKNLPTKVTKPQEVYAGIAKWKYIIKNRLVPRILPKPFTSRCLSMVLNTNKHHMEE